MTISLAAEQAACWLSMTVLRSRSPAPVRGDARKDAYASIPAFADLRTTRLFACLDVETDALVDIARTPTAEPIISRRHLEDRPQRHRSLLPLLSVFGSNELIDERTHDLRHTHLVFECVQLQQSMH